MLAGKGKKNTSILVVVKSRKVVQERNSQQSRISRRYNGRELYFHAILWLSFPHSLLSFDAFPFFLLSIFHYFSLFFTPFIYTIHPFSPPTIHNFMSSPRLLSLPPTLLSALHSSTCSSVTKSTSTTNLADPSSSPVTATQK